MILEYIDCANCYDRGVLNFPKILRDKLQKCASASSASSCLILQLVNTSELNFTESTIYLKKPMFSSIFYMAILFLEILVSHQI